MMSGMRNPKQTSAALRRIVNVADFAYRHKLPLRTLWRVRSSAAGARKGTLALINAALDKEGA
jgi:hypothetical protein